MRYHVNRLCCLLVVSLGFAFRSGPLIADSELDSKAPAGIVKKLDPITNTITSYRVDSANEAIRPEVLDRLSETDRKTAVETFLTSVTKPENKVAEEKASRERSELDGAGSTSANYYSWRGYYGGYYGNSFYNYYGGYNYYYRPYWGYYGSGYYYNAYYYNYSYYPYYVYPYYTYYGYGG